jgi:LuxR family maltose regulon positive regulatory protein
VGSDPGHATALALAHASLLFWAGHVNAARTALHSALPRPHLPLLAAHRDVILADVEVALGRPHAALRLLQPHECGESAVLVAAPRARAFLALRDLDNAHNCIRSVLTAASAQLSRNVLVDAMLCDAQIAQLKGDPGRALEMIAGALDIAHGEIVPPFLRVTDLFAALLARHPAVAAQWPTPLASEPADAISEGGSPSAGDLPEPLTQREHAVLRFLATSMTTAEIAAELCLSVNTVKTHLAAIYRKLAACKRREAVLRARQLELILRRDADHLDEGKDREQPDDNHYHELRRPSRTKIRATPSSSMPRSGRVNRPERVTTARSG